MSQLRPNWDYAGNPGIVVRVSRGCSVQLDIGNARPSAVESVDCSDGMAERSLSLVDLKKSNLYYSAFSHLSNFNIRFFIVINL
jgi:hypothetical protein